MPRVENAGPAVSRWHETADSGSSTFDLCRSCAFYYHGSALPPQLVPYNSGEPRGTLSADVDSPLVDDYDLDGYQCDVCGAHLNTRNY